MSDRIESQMGPAPCRVTLRGSTLTGTIWAGVPGGTCMVSFNAPVWVDGCTRSVQLNASHTRSTGTTLDAFGGKMMRPHELGEFRRTTSQSRPRNAPELFFRVTVRVFPYVLVNGVAVVDPSPSIATLR